MYILVNIETNIIIGCASSAIDEEQGIKNGYRVFEVNDAEFNPNMLGSKLETYEEV